MQKLYSGKDKYGHYILSIEGPIICAVVVGAIGEHLSLKYAKDFFSLIDSIGIEAWGHFADFSQCEALTLGAKTESVSLHEKVAKLGCKVSAFTMNSALLANQINTIRQESNLLEPLNKRIFATKSECIAFIEQYLSELISE